MSFKDKVIWITGASSGIGEALAYAFNGQGAKLILSARRQSELERVKNSCLNKSAEILILPFDLMDYDLVPSRVRTVIAHFGQIDVLINNGGLSQRSLVKDTILAVDKQLMEINYLGTVALTKAVLPYMLQRQSGQLVVVTSLTGKFGTPYRSAYAASKHALHGFFDSLRAELHKDKVKITMICPGFIKTKVSLNALTADGGAQNTMDTTTSNGLLPEVFARKAMKAIAKGKAEVYIGRKEVLMVYVKRYFPSFFRWLLPRVAVK